MPDDNDDPEADQARSRVRQWFRDQVLMGIEPVKEGKPRPQTKQKLTADYKIISKAK